MKRLLTLLVTMTACIAAWAAEPYVVYTPSNTTLTFYYGTKPSGAYGLSNGFPEWYNDGTNANVTRVVFDSSFAQARPTSTIGWFENMENLETILGLNYLNTSQVTNMAYMFYYCKKLTNLNVSGFNTSRVTSMIGMFNGCENLAVLDVSNFNTSNVTDMNVMFRNCKNLTSLDLSNFNTSKTTGMQGMFSNCVNLSNLNISSFNTSNVISMSNMFNGCEHLTTLDLSHFDTSNVKGMAFMFFGCYRLSNLNLSSFNTSKVTSMEQMFVYCYALNNLDLSSFNTSSVTNMSGMLYYCSHLKTVTVSSKWSTSAVTNSNDMFKYCTSLVGGAGTTYSSSHTDASYAHIDGGPSNPGYLTSATSITYDLWVNGVQVTGDNKSGVTGPGISGSVTYEPSTNTLTLNNATIDQRGLAVVAISTAYGSPANFKIKLVGTNKILAYSNSIALKPRESQGFTIYGSGTLNCNGALYLDARDHLTNDATVSYIKDCSVYFDNILSEDYEECLTIDNADVTTEYLYVGADHNGYEGLKLINCYVAQPQGGYVNNGNIYVGSSSDWWDGHVEIKRSAIAGDVNGDGHVSSADITALYDYLLNSDTSNLVNGDVDNDGHITSGDVTAVYSIMLGS